ncbi:MAG TPA: hypothetical protein VJ976_06865 [Ornithinimicrobium sp.]|uniref:hypothetical protein n=1 Tax=Ornithinimicrobium sp. TaxID=1977084 RepID=UPI002B483F13|nr:hypothetical protein [Ornithinimicrobium sp.]HKJ12096.1 hypothetical protein [Ornithinimicrobium sp.]
MTIIDCHTCPVRGQHCASCFVPVVAAPWLQAEGVQVRERPAEGPTRPLTDAEWDAVDVFVAAGMVNPLDVVDLVATAEVAPGPWGQVG